MLGINFEKGDTQWPDTTVSLPITSRPGLVPLPCLSLPLCVPQVFFLLPCYVLDDKVDGKIIHVAD